MGVSQWLAWVFGLFMVVVASALLRLQRRRRQERRQDVSTGASEGAVLTIVLFGLLWLVLSPFFQRGSARTGRQ